MTLSEPNRERTEGNVEKTTNITFATFALNKQHAEEDPIS